ncbi:Sodium:proton antiporter [Bordetella tumbae]
MLFWTLLSFTRRVTIVQSYESIFWGMAIVVLLALAGGALMGRLARVTHSLAGVAAQSLVVLALVAYLAADAGAGGMVALLAIAAAMFSLVIGTAAALLARRVLRERRACID